MTKWDDLYEKLDRREGVSVPSHATPATIARALWPPLLTTLVDDPKRPRPLIVAEAYPIKEATFETWLRDEAAAAGLPEYDSGDPAWKEWDDARLRALGYTPGEVARTPYGPVDFRTQGYVDGIYRALGNVLHAEVAPSDDANDAPDLDEVIPDGGATIEDIADAMGVSRRTAESRVAKLGDDGSIVVVAIPSARGGKPRKRYYRVNDATRPSDESDAESDEP